MARKSFNPLGGGMNINQLMKQAQKMQQGMEQIQEELKQQTLEISSGGGAVTVIINGKKEITSIRIAPDAVDKDDIEMLQDLMLSAVNEAYRQAEEMANKEMSKLTGGMNLPF